MFHQILSTQEKTTKLPPSPINPVNPKPKLKSGGIFILIAEPVPDPPSDEAPDPPVDPVRSMVTLQNSTNCPSKRATSPEAMDVLFTPRIHFPQSVKWPYTVLLQRQVTLVESSLHVFTSEMNEEQVESHFGGKSFPKRSLPVEILGDEPALVAETLLLESVLV